MTTVVNNPAPVQDTGGGNSFLIGAIVFAVFILIGLYFGVPAALRMMPTQINVPAPQIIVPEKLDVNVTQEKP